MTKRMVLEIEMLEYSIWNSYDVESVRKVGTGTSELLQQRKVNIRKALEKKVAQRN